MPVPGRRARLRVGLAADLQAVQNHTGHGTVWRALLRELSALPSVKLIGGGRADVWLASTSQLPEGHPLVVQIHEVGWHGELRQFLEPSFAEHLERLTAAAMDAAAHVITPSQVAGAQVVDAFGWPPERVHPIHHGVDHGRFRPGLTGGRELAGGPYILFVGVLHARKNLGALRQALAGLAERGLPHLLVAVANPPPDRAEPDGRESELQLPGLPGRVRLFRHLRRHDLAALMAGADAFCLPSFFEGFGLPALEAMACGAPVVVSNRGALPEVVGDAGLVVEPTAAAVEDALARVLSDRALADSLRAASLDRASGFSWQSTAQRWLEVLQLAAAGA